MNVTKMDLELRPDQKHIITDGAIRIVDELLVKSVAQIRGCDRFITFEEILSPLKGEFVKFISAYGVECMKSMRAAQCKIPRER